MHKTKSVFTEWLEKLQQESWQLELLISGFAIYGLFAFDDYLSDTSSKMIETAMGTNLMVFIAMLLMAVKLGLVIFIANLLLHVCIRGLWIGAIGLRYVSGDIEYRKLDYSGPFVNFYKKTVGSFDEYIEKLEKFASIIFSYSFLLFFLFLGVISFFLYIVAVSYIVMEPLNNLLSENELGLKLVKYLYAIFLALHFVFGLMVFVDFFTLGFFKKRNNRRFSKFYFRVYRYFGWLTLSFLSRPLLLNFLDNKYTRRLLWLSVPYGVLIGIILPSLSFSRMAYIPTNVLFQNEYFSSAPFAQEYYASNHYEDERIKIAKEDRFPRIDLVSIPSKLIKDDMLEVFVKTFSSIDKYLKEQHPEIIRFQSKGLTFIEGLRHESSERKKVKDSFEERVDALEDKMNEVNKQLTKKERKHLYRLKVKEWRNNFKDSLIQADVRNLQALKDIIESRITIAVDSTVVSKDNRFCDFYEHPGTQEMGLLCYIDLKPYLRGRHHLEVEQLSYQKVYDDHYEDVIERTKIPFIYDKQ